MKEVNRVDTNTFLLQYEPIYFTSDADEYRQRVNFTHPEVMYPTYTNGMLEYVPTERLPDGIPVTNTVPQEGFAYAINMDSNLYELVGRTKDIQVASKEHRKLEDNDRDFDKEFAELLFNK